MKIPNFKVRELRLQKIIIILVLCYSSIPLSASDDSTNVEIFDKDSNKIQHSKHNSIFYTSFSSFIIDQIQFKALSLIYERTLNYNNLERSMDITIGGGVATGVPFYNTNSISFYFGLSEIGSDKYFVNLGFIKQFFDIETGIVSYWGQDENAIFQKDKNTFHNQIYLEFGYKYIPIFDDSQDYFSYFLSSTISLDINQHTGNIIVLPFNFSSGTKPKGANNVEKVLNSLWIYPLAYIVSTFRFTIGYSW